jgi:hypothetical protein
MLRLLLFLLSLCGQSSSGPTPDAGGGYDPNG